MLLVILGFGVLQHVGLGPEVTHALDETSLELSLSLSALRGVERCCCSWENASITVAEQLD